MGPNRPVPARGGALPVANRGADRYFELKSQIHRKLIGVLNLERASSIPKDRIRAEIGRVVERLLDEERVPMTTAEQTKIVEEVLDEVLGLGPLETLLKEPSISDILVNRYNKVFIERNGKLSETTVRFKDDAHLLHIIEKIVSQVGRRIDEAQPIVDARLQDGSRVNAIIPPLALDGPCLSIRRFGRHVITQDEMVQYKTLTPGILRFLSACVQCKVTVLISGGTGSGKTTMLNALSRFIPEEERIITIEDTAELQLQQRHVIKFETRPPNLNKEGGINQRILLRTALRMRPDRIIVGECRGAEALDMLQAMNTGVEGSMSTVHANTPRDAFSRLETMVMMADLEIPTRVILQQLASAIKLVVQVSRLQDGTPQSPQRQRSAGREGRKGGPAGDLHLRTHRRHRCRQGAGPLPCHRHHAQTPGAPAHQRRNRAAGDLRGSRPRESVSTLLSGGESGARTGPGQAS